MLAASLMLYFYQDLFKQISACVQYSTEQPQGPLKEQKYEFLHIIFQI